MSITFGSLDNTLKYDLVGFVNGGGTRSNSRLVEMSADGQSVARSGALTSGGSTSGTLSPSILTGLETDGAGNLVVEFYFPQSYGIGGLTLTAVPEPGSLALLSLGGLLIARRRRG